MTRAEPLLKSATVDTPVGRLLLVAGDAGLRAVLWPDDRPGRVALPTHEPGRHPVLSAAATQIDEYFAGTRRGFELPLDLQGTDFQRAAWNALRGIRYGTTSTYAQHAATMGRPTATRAVGAAIGRNPISIVLPCHRVVGADGSLTGFAGGVQAKRTLLDLEATVLTRR